MLKALRNFLATLLIGAASIPASATPRTFFDLTATDIEGCPTTLEKYRGQVVLVVNTASKCGFTGQYEDLEKIYLKYKDSGFVVLGFPSNDFMSQEPGSNEDIKSFCTGTYGVTFPLFAKAPVTGETKQEVFKYLTEESGYSGILWNFEKFLVDRNGKVVDRWRSITSPSSSSITGEIEKLLGLG